MDDFALVTEGVTDHAILKNILFGYFKEQRTPIINRDHPDPNSELHHGGWTLVFRYLREKKYRQALQHNRFVVVQIDTDVAEEIGFDVPKQNEDGPLPIGKLIENVINRLKQEIGEEDWSIYGESFIFAIGVEQLECWVLPLWFSDAKAAQVANCTDRLGGNPQLRDSLTRKGLPWIRAEEKDSFSYAFASQEYKKRRSLHADGVKNPSLKIFLDDLEQRNIQLVTLVDE